MSSRKNQLIALSAVFQAASGVISVARQGQFNTHNATPLLHALFQFDAPDVKAVYGAIDSLQEGMRQLEKQLQSPDKEHIELAQLAMAIIALAAKLHKAQLRLQNIQQGLESIKIGKLPHFELTHTNTLAAIADIYKQQISDLSPRILIKGEPLYLENSDNQARIRALLLAGLRSAILWKQLGGSRLVILFQRKKLLASLQQYIQSAIE